jgi:hypothetical protein
VCQYWLDYYECEEMEEKMYTVNETKIKENKRNSILTFVILTTLNIMFVFVNINLNFVFSNYVSIVGAILVNVGRYYPLTQLELLITYSCLLIPLVLLSVSYYLADKNRFGFILAIIVCALDILICLYVGTFTSTLNWEYALPVIANGWLIIDCGVGLHNFNILKKFEENE